MSYATQFTIALAGNPNTGKSTVFNSLTGLRQHTGNWPGKTVAYAEGTYTWRGTTYRLVDLPGTYSLLTTSLDEDIARAFIASAEPQVTVIVTDATCLERNLILVLQVLELTDKVVVCVNLMDEARRKGIALDTKKLANELGVPVVATNARDGDGVQTLQDTIWQVATGELVTRPMRVSDTTPRGEPDTAHCDPRGEQSSSNSADFLMQDAGDLVAQNLVTTAHNIASRVVTLPSVRHDQFDRKVDNILLSRFFGFPIMLLALGVIFWLTIVGANYPGEVLSHMFTTLEAEITAFAQLIGTPLWLQGLLITGVYRTMTTVIAVMLPPMAIFFPLFTLLEDLGFLPRVAFNLDNFFKRCGAHGKQALSMCMGFGCNAAGVIACRIIDSPREKLIAILTNNFVPCNGRFPILIVVATIFLAGMGGTFGSLLATLAVLMTVICGVLLTMLIAKLLSLTLLKGLPSSFTLELPPYRRPQLGRVLVRSFIDRTLFVLSRAVIVAAPAGIALWVMGNFSVGGNSLLSISAGFLDPLGRMMGLDGFILLAFILGLPANEIVIPILIMGYMRTTAMLELDSLEALRQLFVANGWTTVTAICTMLFALCHWPCGTTLLTAKKETGSLKWTALAFLIPTLTGILVCTVVAQGARLLGPLLGWH